jgi:hypothetical protein
MWVRENQTNSHRAADPFAFFIPNRFVQLNMWCFDRKSVSGAHKGAFYHPFFVRGQKLACQHLCREIFKTHTWSKISNTKSATDKLGPSATLLDARKASSCTVNSIDNSDVDHDDFWKESDVSTSHKTDAALTVMSSESKSSNGIGIPIKNGFDSQYSSKNEGVSNLQISESYSMRIEKLQSNDVSHCPLPSNLAAARKTTPAIYEPYANTVRIKHDFSDSQYEAKMLNAGVNQPVLEDGVRGEFEGRQFFFVDME